MSENGFVPFSPRRLERVVEASPDSDLAAIAAPAPECSAAESEHVDVEAPEAVTQLEATTVGNAVEASHIGGALDGARVRDEAIRLAATACSRALRYAVDRNPRLVARFVDDALRAAGSPRHAIVRVAPSATASAQEQREHDYVADTSLAPGDVFIVCADGTLGATIEQRAEGLVRAASS